MQHDRFQPSEITYSHRFRVEVADIDEFGHANNVVWIRWVNDAALAHAEHVGLGPDACRELGALWVVRRHEIEYLLPAFAGEELTALTWPESVKGATSLRCTLFQRDGKTLARAATTWVLLDTHTGKPTRVRPQMRERYRFKDRV